MNFFKTFKAAFEAPAAIVTRLSGPFQDHAVFY